MSTEAGERPPIDLVWGIHNIAAVIGRSPRQCYEALVKGELPARQVNKRWVVSRRRLEAFFEGDGDERR